jgi:hypothetical protein
MCAGVGLPSIESAPCRYPGFVAVIIFQAGPRPTQMADGDRQSHKHNRDLTTDFHELLNCL